ncbi:Uncharacterised protein [Mycobacteroides abscessus subsp. abscessus]|nr:Uncharacterised protein [Mycobacteroides abscessus subsp. abscessus]
MPDRITDPFGLLLQTGRHVAQRGRRRERRAGGQQIRIAVHHQAHGGADVTAPVLTEGTSVTSTNVDPRQCACACIEAGRHDDHVEFVE